MPPKATGGGVAGKQQAEVVANSGVPDETAIRQAALVSSTFANVELQTTRQTLKQYVQLFDEAKEENQRLTGELVERDKDSMRVVQFLRAELDSKVAEIANLHKSHKADVDKLRSDFHQERKQLLAEISDRDAAVVDLENQLSVIRGDLAALQQFADDRDRLYDEMNAFREHHQRECERYEAEISRLRFVSLEDKVRVKAEERIMTEKFEAEVSDRAMKLLDVKTREIHNENFALLEDKVLLEQEIDRLTEENKSMKGITGAQRREVELAKVADEEYAKRGARQSREIKELRQQCKMMEANIAKLIDEYEHKIDVESHKTQTQIDKLKEERDLAYRNAEVRHKELIKMRHLSKTIVRQRSELEMFFNEALEHVRQQILAERQLAVQARFHVQQPELLKGAHGSGARLLIGSGTTAPPPPPQQQMQPSSKAPGRTNSALISSDHPFFQGARDFDSIYHEDIGAAGNASRRSSAAGQQPPQPRLGSSGLPAIKPASTQSSIQQHPTSAALVPSRHSTPGQISSSAAQPVNPPPLASSGGGVAGALAATADISTLSWPDKERVLRILLAKINNAARYERRDHADLSRTNGEGVISVLAPAPVPKQILAGNSDTFLTQ